MKKIFLVCALLMGLLSGQAMAAGQLGVLWDWQAPGEKTSTLVEKEKVPGIDILSPSWFIISDAKGDIRVRNAAKDYVSKAHSKGYKVWALITNDFDPDMTSQLLASTSARAKVIKKMRQLADKYDIDGYNLDFENINPEDKYKLTSFVAEIARELHQDGLMISLDVTVPSDSGRWSQCYDRKALAAQVDYVMLMAYDEHSRDSSESGSVSSLGWVEEGIQNTLAEGVPASKLVLGMPLYMRLWQEKDGKITASTLSMSQAENMIADKGLQPQWLPEQGQYYFEYRENGIYYRVWQENRRSLALKAGLINRYDLAGAAYWRSTLETQDVWQGLAFVIENGKY